MNHIIAVSSLIGGGKTSLVTSLASGLHSATSIHYDHYERITDESTDYLKQWLNRGADFNEFKIPGLSDDLGRLMKGESIIDPLTKEEIYSGRYIIFETPLGRDHEDTARYIDWLIWIDIPFDLALARKVKEFTSLFLAEKGNLFDRVSWLDHYLENYMKIVRDVLEIQREKVIQNADIILDGKKDLDLLVSEAKGSIENRFS